MNLSIRNKAVGDFERMLRDSNLWSNTLLIVTADNGGETRWGGNNYPLRSQKFSLYDGGLRVNSFVSGGLIESSKNKNSHYDQLFHVSDWHDTILEAADCPINQDKGPLSGVSHWPFTRPDPRTVLLHNIDPMKMAKGDDNREWIADLTKKYKIDIRAQSAVRFDGWKLLTGDPVMNVPDGNIVPPEAKNQDPESKLRFQLDYRAQEQIDYFNPPSKTLTQLVHLFHIDKDEGKGFYTQKDLTISTK